MPSIYIDGSKTVVNAHEFEGSEWADLEYVVLPNVSVINEYAFRGCRNLLDIKIPECEVIRTEAFRGCINLEYVYAPKVSALGSAAFNDCSRASKVFMPNLSSIYSWYQTSSITRYDTPFSNFGSEATTLKFKKISELPNVGSTETIYILGSEAYRYVPSNVYVSEAHYSKLCNIDQNDGIGTEVLEAGLRFGLYGTEIRYSYLQDSMYSSIIDQSSRTTDVPLNPPSKVMPIIQENVFSHAGFSDLYVPSAMAIYSMAFADCNNLSKAFLPSTYYVGDRAFLGCENLKEITTPTATGFGPNAFRGCTNLRSISAPNLTMWGTNPKENWELRALEAAYLPRLGTVPDEAFNNCSNLRVFANQTADGTCALSKIGSSAFRNCSNLSTITLKNVTEIGEHAFSGCMNLQECVAPNLQYVPSAAFRNCYSLSEVHIDNCYGIGQSGFANTKLVSIIGNNVQNIDDSAFEGCAFLQVYSFPNCRTIGNFAFYNCSNLSNIFTNASAVGEYAFGGCRNAKKAHLENVHSIGRYALVMCTELEELFIGDLVNCPSMLFDDFYGGGCPNLRSIHYNTSKYDENLIEAIIRNMRYVKPDLLPVHLYIPAKNNLKVYDQYREFAKGYQYIDIITMNPW